MFYVYVYCDTRKPGSFIYGDLKFDYEPFYVGKGKGMRMYSHLFLKEKNNFKNRKIQKILNEDLEPLILKIKENLSENEAFEIEKEIIKIIGRGKLGPLTNLTSGGEGSSENDSCKSEAFKLKMKQVAKKWQEDNPEKDKIKREGVSKRIKKLIEKLGHGPFKNKCHSQKSKEKIGKTNSVKQQGQSNSQYGTCWITKDKKNKKIKKEELEICLNNGWSKGRVLK